MNSSDLEEDFAEALMKHNNWGDDDDTRRNEPWGKVEVMSVVSPNTEQERRDKITNINLAVSHQMPRMVKKQSSNRQDSRSMRGTVASKSN